MKTNSASFVEKEPYSTNTWFKNSEVLDIYKYLQSTNCYHRDKQLAHQKQKESAMHHITNC